MWYVTLILLLSDLRKDIELCGFKISNIVSTFTDTRLNPEATLTDVAREGR